jgi:hypothetical protein
VRPPLSRLAVASILLAVIACPCLDNEWTDLVERLVGRRTIPDSARVLFVLPGLALAIAILAALRIRLSRGRRRGMEWAALAILIASVWITVCTFGVLFLAPLV